MGGCCCCGSRSSEEDDTPEYRHLARTSEERVPLSSSPATTSSVATGLLVDTNLETSSIDTYRPPPPPTPYTVNLGYLLSQPNTLEVSGTKVEPSARTTNSESTDRKISGNTLESAAKCEEIKESECDEEIDFDVEAEKKRNSESGRIFALPIEEEDDCPICLEEYDKENPKLTTKCEHHFHLACILEWMERSNTCPVCDKEMLFSPSH